MFSRLFLISTLLTSLFFLPLSQISFADASDCDAASQGNAAEFLAKCASGTTGIQVKADGSVTSVKDRIVDIAKKAIAFGALLAVGAIVWAGIQYTKSFGEDESLKKAKNTGIYAVIGLILLMSAFGLVDIIINFIYGLG